MATSPFHVPTYYLRSDYVLYDLRLWKYLLLLHNTWARKAQVEGGYYLNIGVLEHSCKDIFTMESWQQCDEIEEF